MRSTRVDVAAMRESCVTMGWMSTRERRQHAVVSISSPTERDEGLGADRRQKLSIVAGDNEPARPRAQRPRQGALTDEVQAERGLVEDQELDSGQAPEKRDERRTRALSRAKRAQGTVGQRKRKAVGYKEVRGVVRTGPLQTSPRSASSSVLSAISASAASIPAYPL
jgi:hypothetical protein